MPKFLNDIKLEQANDIQFKTTAGANAGKIEQDGNNLVLSNAVGDVLLGDGASDIFIGDGTNNVDVIFEQSGSIKGDGSAVTLTLGGANTTLNLENPNINGSLSIGATTINNKLTFTTNNGYILFDYEPTTSGGEYTTEVPLLKVDRSGSELTILSRVSNNGAVILGNDDGVAILAGDVKSVIKDNLNLSGEEVIFAAEAGFSAYGFPSNDTSWSNRNQFRFRSDSGTAGDNGLYIGDGGSTQFIDLSRNLVNIGSITATSLDINGNADISGTLTLGGHLQEPILRTEVSVANSYVRIFTVTDASGQLATMTRLSGTSHGSGHVGNFTALIMTNHSGDVVVKSFSSFYTEVTIKVDTNTNADATISIKSDTSNAATYKLKIETLSPGATYALLPSSGINPAVSHEHSAGDGSNETGVGGTLTHDFGGEINAASLDISGDADIDGTLNADGLDVDGNADISGNLTGLDSIASTAAFINTGSSLFSAVATFNGDTYTTGAYKLGTSGTYVGKIYNSSGKLTIESDGDRDIQFQSSNNASIMYIDSSTQRVGIGHATLYQKFTVNGNIDVRGGDGCLLTFNNGDGGIGVHFNNTGTVGRDIAIKTYEEGVGNTEKMRVTKKGDVGIGTSSPSSKLHIASGTNADGVLLTGLGTSAGMGTGNYKAIDFQYSAADSSFGSAIRFVVANHTAHGGQIELWTDNSSGTNTKALTINSSQNATFAGNVDAKTLTIDGSSLGSYHDFQSKPIDSDSGLFTVGGHGEAGGYSRAVSIFTSHDGVWNSWVGTNLRWDGTNFKRASDAGNNNWGNIAGIRFLGNSATSGAAIKFIIDPPEQSNAPSGEQTIGTSLPSSMTALSINNDLSVTFAGNIVMAANATVDGRDISSIPTSFAPTNAQANVAPTTAQVKTALNANLGTVTVGDADDDINIQGNLTVTGVTTMSGGTVINTTTNTAIKDTTIFLNSGINSSTANVADIGLILDRGSTGNVFMGWDESEDEFIFAKTSSEGSDDVGAATGGGTPGIVIDNEETDFLHVKVGTLESVGAITSGGSDILTAGTAASSFPSGLQNSNVTSVTGSSGSCTGNAATATALSTTLGLTTVSMTFQLATNTWTDTGIDGTDLATGTYAMQVYVEDFHAGGGHYYEYYSATISWYSGSTNSTGHDEIVLHRAGHASNASHLQVRTLRASNSDTHDLMLQVKQNFAHTAALNGASGKTMIFKFRRLI